MEATTATKDKITRLDLPADPRDLLDLLDLRDKLTIFNSLKNNLDDYIIGYACTFIKPMQAVLDEIPIEEHELYIRNKKFKSLVNELKSELNYERGWNKGEDTLAEPRQQPHYIIDFKEKVLHKFGAWDKMWTPGGAFWETSWSYEMLPKNQLKVKWRKRCHSCVSRPHNEHVTADIITTMTFDMGTNTFVSFTVKDKEKDRRY